LCVNVENFVIDKKTKQKKELKNENRLFFCDYTDKRGRNIFNDGRHITKKMIKENGLIENKKKKQ